MIPPCYPFGTDDPKKNRAVRLWQAWGPYATRNFTAANYQNNYGELGAQWDWAAKSRDVGLPAPLDLAARRMDPPGTPGSRGGDGGPPPGFPSPSPRPSSVPPRRPPSVASQPSRAPPSVNPYANVKPPPPARSSFFESAAVRPPPERVIEHISEDIDMDRARSSRDGPPGEDRGGKGSGMRGESGTRYTRSDWVDKKPGKNDWHEHKTNWSARGWSETRRYREDGRRK